MLFHNSGECEGGLAGGDSGGGAGGVSADAVEFDDAIPEWTEEVDFQALIKELKGFGSTLSSCEVEGLVHAT